MNYIKTLLILVLVSILACTFASAELDVNVVSVKAEDINVNLLGTETFVAGLEKGDEIEVVVTFITNFDGDVEVEAELSGDGKKDKVIDSTDEFTVHNGTTYKKTLTLKLPSRMDQDQSYQLRVTISDRYDFKTVTGILDIASVDHVVEIKDITLSPENEVKAGRALLVTARIKNRGTKDEEDVKIKASVPEFTPTAYFTPENLAMVFSKSSTSFLKIKSPFFNTRKIAPSISFFKEKYCKG